MKKCVLLVLCACTFLAAVVACKKNDRSSSPPVATYDSLPGNPLNPYDSFGYWHNLILDSLDVEHAKGKCKDLATYAGYAGAFCKANGWKRNGEPETNHAQVAQMIIDFTSDPNGFVDGMQWSDSVKTRLQDLFSRLDTGGATDCSYEKLKAIIVDFEQEILESSLPESDKEVILKASSTARFSGYRWNGRPELAKPFEQAEVISYLQQQNIPVLMAKVSKEKPGFFKRVGRWIAVSAIDVMGAVHYLSAAEGAVISGYAGLTMDLMDKFH
ncbi:MAG TPA: hypothetical protein VL943_12080 [Niabella sp.]|nr:hypothetical protein [Niabella sp.]